MELLTLPHFLELLLPYASKSPLTPLDALRMQLYITELLVDHFVDFPLLKFLSRFLTQQALDEIIEERNIEHQCGYLVCGASPRHLSRRLSHSSSGVSPLSPTFQIYNRKPSLILPNTYLSQYCCKAHYQALIFFRNQLSNELVFARENILSAPPFSMDQPLSWYENNITCLEEVLERHRQLRSQGKSLADVVNMMSGLSVSSDASSADTSELARLIEDFEIIEHENPQAQESGVESDDDADDQHFSSMSFPTSRCVA